MIWDGEASTANEFFGESYGEDWVYEGERRAILVKNFNTGEMLKIEIGNEVTKAQDGFITVKRVKKHYVLGFLTFGDYEVVLLRKNRPKWQKGLLNGIGGKIEMGESPLEAMHRETLEEIGAQDIPWVKRGMCCFAQCNVHVFYARVERVDIKQIEDEKVIVIVKGMIPYMKAVKDVEQLLTLCESNYKRFLLWR